MSKKSNKSKNTSKGSLSVTNKRDNELLRSETLYGNCLFDREHPSYYQKECQESLSQPLIEEQKIGESVLIFRVLDEWLALRTYSIKEINEMNTVHCLPHTSNEVLMGLTNIQGQLKIAISIKDLLGFEVASHSSELDFSTLSTSIYPRFIVFGIGKDDFVFPVSEVYGIHFLEEGILEEAPLTVSKSLANYTSGIFHFEKEPVGLLDENILFESINQNYL